MDQFVHKMNEQDEEQMGTAEKKQQVQDEEEDVRKELEKKDFGINEENEDE